MENVVQNAKKKRTFYSSFRVSMNRPTSVKPRSPLKYFQAELLYFILYVHRKIAFQVVEIRIESDYRFVKYDFIIGSKKELKLQTHVSSMQKIEEGLRDLDK